MKSAASAVATNNKSKGKNKRRKGSNNSMDVETPAQAAKQVKIAQSVGAAKAKRNALLNQVRLE